ncbi:MAG TPA: endonuclease/exonuclease/phosphatase family protein [Bacillota bacterium]|nr:endonuclease/exonuclease/phosphatase family protein [Clostridiales bacterium]HPT85356.1 endonuclease/exonuclease/phosphatase family protein [Bacillota bacterium]
MLKIVTYNLRTDTSHDGPQAFPYRKPYIRDRLLEEKPDIIGFQEVQPHMLAWLREVLEGYEVLGYGRGKNFGDEANPIAYRKDRFELQYFDQRWLSDTPFVPGSRFADQSGCPRIFAVCLLRDLEEGGHGRFRFVNTHLDHERDYAKIEGAKQIVAEIDRLNGHIKLPVIITGDFNATPGSEPLAVFERAGYVDLSASSGGTFHGYGRAKSEAKIDYIMSTPDVKILSVRMWTEVRDGLYLSDHYPVEVTVESFGE